MLEVRKGFHVEHLADVYLCGVITDVAFSAADTWRQYAHTALMARGLKVLNPMRRDYQGRQYECRSEIVALDLADIARCRTLLVNGNAPSWGSGCELVHAAAGKKLVVTFADVVVTELSPFLSFYSDVVTKTLDGAILELATRLGRLEDQADVNAAREALREPGTTPWDEVKGRLGL